MIKEAYTTAFKSDASTSGYDVMKTHNGKIGCNLEIHLPEDALSIPKLDLTAAAVTTSLAICFVESCCLKSLPAMLCMQKHIDSHQKPLFMFFCLFFLYSPLED